MFEWSKEGLQLLNEINVLIDRYGGAEKLSHIIEIEQLSAPPRQIKPIPYIKKPYSEYETNFIVENFPTMFCGEIAKQLNRETSSIKQKIKSLQQKEILKYKSFYLFLNVEKIKEKIKQSGLKQGFIADKIGIGASHLTMMLNGNATMPEHIRNQINELLAKVTL